MFTSFWNVLSELVGSKQASKSHLLNAWQSHTQLNNIKVHCIKQKCMSDNVHRNVIVVGLLYIENNDV